MWSQWLINRRCFLYGRRRDGWKKTSRTSSCSGSKVAPDWYVVYCSDCPSDHRALTGRLTARDTLSAAANSTQLSMINRRRRRRCWVTNWLSPPVACFHQCIHCVLSVFPTWQSCPCPSPVAPRASTAAANFVRCHACYPPITLIGYIKCAKQRRA